MEVEYNVPMEKYTDLIARLKEARDEARDIESKMALQRMELIELDGESINEFSLLLLRPLLPNRSTIP